ncbi:helix-turn-helix domain-containing protein [Leptospira kmetyi]|uniref:helix-turn-helix domain-containing protein n=1 Tax=Leptospira kmetyi TaxID=408139 RepID=UPI000287E3DE|nr:helix-turn-helix domain-containing protein [Leptospira kmetyi]
MSESTASRPIIDSKLTRSSFGITVRNFFKIGKILPSFFEPNSQLKNDLGGLGKERDLLQNVDLEEVKTNLEGFIERKEYKDEEMRLPDFAIYIGLTTHQASHYLNKHLKMSFADFMNFNRIEEAKRIIARSGDKLNLLDIAFESGFNSLSSFHRACRKFTGMSPKEIRYNLLD